MAELRIDVVKCPTCGGANKYDIRVWAGGRWATVKTDGLEQAVGFATTLGQLLTGAGHDVIYSGLCSAGGA